LTFHSVSLDSVTVTVSELL